MIIPENIKEKESYLREFSNNIKIEAQASELK